MSVSACLLSPVLAAFWPLLAVHNCFPSASPPTPILHIPPHTTTQAAVLGMLELKEFATFKQHLRDFLVQSNQFMDQNNAELYSEEVSAAVRLVLEGVSLNGC